MSSSVLLLVLFSSFCHASWNFAARKAAGNMVALWLGLWLGCGLISPIAISVVVSEGLLETVRPQAIICMVATGLIHAVYFRLLAAAYEHGEISLVYPIARGSGIALTAALAAFFLKESFTFVGAIGIGLISVSILSLYSAQQRTGRHSKAVAFALCTGGSIVVYSLVDKIGVGYISPFVYIWSMVLIAAVALTPFVMWRYRGTIRQTSKQYIGYALIIGVGSVGSYLMILFAFTTEPVGYVVAVRESAIIWGSLAGIIFLKERFTIIKIVVTCVIVIGIICIKMS